MRDHAFDVQAHPLPIARLALYECAESQIASLHDPDDAAVACPQPRAAGDGRRVPSADADALPYDVASIEGECQVLPYWLRIGADPPPIVLKPMVAERGGAEEAGAAGGGAIGLGSDELPAVEHYGARGWTRRVGSVDLITLPHLALRGDAPTQPATDGAAEQPGIAARLRSKFLEAISAMASTFQARSGSSAAPPAVPPAAPINLAGGDFASLLQPKPGGAPLTAGSHEQIQAVLQALSQQMGQNMRAVVTVNAEGQLAISMAERHTERFRHASTVRALARVHRFHAICDTWAFAWVSAQRHLLSVDAPPDYGRSPRDRKRPAALCSTQQRQRQGTIQTRTTRSPMTGSRQRQAATRSTILPMILRLFSRRSTRTAPTIRTALALPTMAAQMPIQNSVAKKKANCDGRRPCGRNAADKPAAKLMRATDDGSLKAAWALSAPRHRQPEATVTH